MREFKSIGEFVEYLRAITPAAEAAVQRGLRDGGAIIQEEAQHSIGHYQDTAGPFPAWAPLAQSTLDGFTDEHGHHHPGKVELGFAPPDNPLKRTEELHDHIELSVAINKAVVGVPSEMVGDGTPENPTRNIGDVALWMEMGDRTTPARSFLGRAAFVKAREAVHAIGSAAQRALAGLPYLKPPSHETSDDIPF